MDDDTATRFVSSLVKSIQALCNGYIDFSSSIEVIGHIHLNIDRNLKLDYVLTEEVNKSISEGATVFASHSYHSHPPPSLTKTSNENSGRNKKSQQQKDTDTHGSLPTEVPNAGRSVNRFGDSGDSSNSGRSEFDPASVKQEKRSSCQVRDSFERRRRPAPSSHTPSPAAKRSRNNDTSSSAEVIEIKEEFDDEPAVYFGNVAGGGDIQTPDFSNVVMESLDRVSQAEGGSLVPPDGSQQSPFPVMLHSNMPSTSGSVPGQSDPRASTSGDQDADLAENVPWDDEASQPTGFGRNSGRKKTTAKWEDDELEMKIKQGLPFKRTPRQMQKFLELDAWAQDIGNSKALNEFTIQCGKCGKTLLVPSDRTPAMRIKYFKQRHYDNRCIRGQTTGQTKTTGSATSKQQGSTESQQTSREASQGSAEASYSPVDLRQADSRWVFPERVRRPPQDPAQPSSDQKADADPTGVMEALAEKDTQS